MALAVGNTAAQQFASGTSLVANMPTGIASGNLLVSCWVIIGNAVSMTPPAGWDLQKRHDSGTTDSALLYTRIAGGSEPSTYEWTAGSAVTAAQCTTIVTGHDAGTPMDATPSGNGGNGTTVTATGITTVTADTILFFQAGTNSGTYLCSLPTGFTNLYGPGSGTPRFRVAYKAQAATGATGDVTGTLGSARDWDAILSAIRPDTGAPAGQPYGIRGAFVPGMKRGFGGQHGLR